MSEETDQKMRNLIGGFNVEDKINYMLGAEEADEVVVDEE